ncbi:MAG: sterol desaturase family protein, partial [Pseudomonadota bacterium]
MDALLELLNTQYGLHVTLRDLILFGLSPVFIATFIAEVAYLKRKGVLDKFIDLKESIMNFTLGGAYQIAEGVVNLVLLAGFLAWFETFQVTQIPVDGVLSALLLFVLVEFFYYWYHRSSHRIRWFWCAHVVHHSSENMNFSTAMRQSIMYPISGNFIFFLPVILIGFSAEAVFACYAVNLAYQYFIHTQQIPKLHPWIEFVFNTPSHHRAHHGVNEKYIDMNYGGIVIVFDRLFNTFV